MYSRRRCTSRCSSWWVDHSPATSGPQWGKYVPVLSARYARAEQMRLFAKLKAQQEEQLAELKAQQEEQIAKLKAQQEEQLAKLKAEQADDIIIVEHAEEEGRNGWRQEHPIHTEFKNCFPAIRNVRKAIHGTGLVNTKAVGKAVGRTQESAYNGAAAVGNLILSLIPVYPTEPAPEDSLVCQPPTPKGSQPSEPASVIRKPPPL